MTAFTLVAPPEMEPVTLEETKAQARVDTDADDALISGLVIAARQWAEHYTGRAFISQTWQMWMDNWSGADHVTLAHPPLASVSSVQVFDDSDVGTVWDAANYFVDNAREPGRLALRSNACWPAPSRETNGILIEYVAGYGSDASAVPELIKLAIKQLATHWYEHRGEATASGMQWDVPLIIQALLNPYRLQRVGV